MARLFIENPCHCLLFAKLSSAVPSYGDENNFTKYPFVLSKSVHIRYKKGIFKRLYNKKGAVQMFNIKIEFEFKERACSADLPACLHKNNRIL